MYPFYIPITCKTLRVSVFNKELLYCGSRVQSTAASILGADTSSWSDGGDQSSWRANRDASAAQAALLAAVHDVTID